jgi:uncharacterized protein YjiS (DUF1127 family)
MLQAASQRASHRTSAAWALPWKHVSTAVIAIGTKLALWAQRIRERGELRDMDEVARRECSLSPSDISRETDKWFWQK